jgi:hypothetical protein
MLVRATGASDAGFLQTRQRLGIFTHYSHTQQAHSCNE